MAGAGLGPLKSSITLMDPTVPRPAARFPILPTPFTFEKPSPQVPDVSLIFDSSSLSNQNISPILRRPQTSANTSRASRPPTPPPALPVSAPKVSTSMGSLEVQMMYDLMKKQEEAILRLESQLKFVLRNQDVQSKNIESVLQLIKARLPEDFAPRVKTCDQAIQTQRTEELATNKLIETCTTAVRIQTSTSTSISEMCIASQNNGSTAVERSRSSSSDGSTLSSGSPPNIPQTKHQVEKSNVICVKNPREPKKQQSVPQQNLQMQQIQQPINRFENVKDRYVAHEVTDLSSEHNKEDLSTILRDLQLPTIQESSIFSEVSIPPIDMQDFNDSNTESDYGSPQVGPSASACGSSSSDEEDYSNAVQPTVTFYRNVIGNVNKMLENTQDSAIFGSSDTTTIYGMSSNNLSFATKQYLQKYGLVEKSSKTKNKGNIPSNNSPRETSPPLRMLPTDHNRTPTNHENNHRVLNLNALKNQPKFI